MQKKLLFLTFLFFGYSQVLAQVHTDSLTKVFQNKSILQQDVLRVLSGMYPGLQITSTGGLSGSGTIATIRGYSSLNAGSDPLLIVDGIRVDSRNNQNNSSFTGGGTLTTPNRSIDINPAEIIDIKIMNSLLATIRYGEDARNGVIEITTTRSTNSLETDKFEFSYQQGFYGTQIGSRPDYQNQFGMGFSGQNSPTYSSWGPAFSPANENSFGSNFEGFDEDGTILISHPITAHNLTASAFPVLAAQTYRYEAKPTAIDEFFNNSLSSSTNLKTNYRSGNHFLNFDYAGNWEDGFTPQNTLKRNIFSASYSYPLLEKVQGRSHIQFAFTDIESPTLSAGSGSGRVQNSAGPSIFSDIFYTPRSLGFDIPYENPQTGGSAYYRVGNDILNPRWVTQNTKTSNNSNRIYGLTEVVFNASDHLKVDYLYAFESYEEDQQYGINPSFVANYPFQTGLYQSIDVNRTFFEHQLNFLYRDEVANHFEMNVDVGLHYLSETFDEGGSESIDIRESGVFSHDNFRTRTPLNSFTNNLFERDFERRTFAVFSMMKLDYKRLIATEIGIRGEFNQSLFQQDLSAWYPGIKISYWPTNHFEQSLGVLSSAKIEFGYSTSGRSIFTEEELLVQNRASVRVNENIKPERSTEREVGLSVGFLDERLTIASTYYIRTHTDLISRIADSGTPGFSSILDNLMEFESEGLEISLYSVPIQQKFQWSIQGNVTTIKSEVKEYTGTFNAIQLGNSLSNRGNAALIDEPFMVMYGSKILRVDQDLVDSNPNFSPETIGAPLIDDFGNYLTGEVGIIGNPFPKWNASMIHQFSYKNVGLSIQFDYQRGGEMYSTWIASMLGRGVISETTKANRTETFIIEGVRFDGTANEIELNAQQYYFNNTFTGPDELRVYDMTHFRISHIGMTYDVPEKWLQNSRIHQVNISISVENAFLTMPNIPEGTGFDPNVNSNGAGVNNMGFEYLTGPSARRFGGAVRVNF